MEILPLAGVRALVVEDEGLIAFLHEDTLIGAGCASVQVAATVEAAIALIDTDNFDVAVVDLNLGGEKAWPVADVLRHLGTPFIFCTGYGRDYAVKERSGVTLLARPYLAADLVRAVGTALGKVGVG